MTKVLLVLIGALIFEAMGVVFLSKGLKQIGEPERINVRELGRLLGRGATNGNILLGVALEATFFGALLYLLAQRDVSLIWPLTSLGFVLTVLAAKFILHEPVSPVRWVGVVFIVVGASLVSYSEKPRPNPGAPPAVSPAETPPG